MACEMKLAANDAENQASAYEPSFSQPVHSAMPWQELMGTCGFTAARFESRHSEQFAALRALPSEQWLAMLADAQVPLAARLMAGELLALSGDPRLHTFAPAMCPLPAAQVEIGLDESELPSLMAKYAKLGVDASWLRKEVPRHAVQLAAFQIARFPVTNLEYRQFLIESGAPAKLLPSNWLLVRYPQERANHPVYGILPEAADAYAAWLATVTGRAFRLPTEAEWEYAAAGQEGREFPWGAEFAIDKANTAELGLFNTTPVGIFPDGAAACGALDMAGNVEEYVQDSYLPYLGGPWIKDDLYQLDPAYRIARGGSFARYRDLARCRRRHGANHSSPVYIMGFRLAEDIV